MNPALGTTTEMDRAVPFAIDMRATLTGGADFEISGTDPRNRNLSPHTVLVTIEAGVLDRMLHRIAQIEPLQASIQLSSPSFCRC